MKTTLERSRLLALIVVFASLNVVCDSIPGTPQPLSGVWYSWIFMTEPMTGLILPPYAAFLSTLVGVMAGHAIYPRGPYEFLFTIGAPVGSMVSGLLLEGRDRVVLVCFVALFAAYFATPISWQLPWWGMWDTFCAFAALIMMNLLYTRQRRQKRLRFDVALYTFIGLEADILFRIFLFIPCQIYRLFPFTVEELQFIWLGGAIVTPIQVSLSVLFTSSIGIPLMKIVERIGSKQ